MSHPSPTVPTMTTGDVRATRVPACAVIEVLTSMCALIYRRRGVVRVNRMRALSAARLEPGDG